MIVEWRQAMKRLTPDEVQAGFQLLGLGTEEERAKFARFAPAPEEELQEFTRFETSSQPPGDSDAELA